MLRKLQQTNVAIKNVKNLSANINGTKKNVCFILNYKIKVFRSNIKLELEHVKYNYNT